MQRYGLLAVAGVAVALAACGGDDEDPAESGGGQTVEERTATVPASGGGAVGDEVETSDPDDPDAAGGGSAPSTGGDGDAAARPCLQGSYVSRSFVGRRSFESPFGKIALSGRGRGLGLDFEGRRWTFHGVGDRPMRGRALGIRGTLKVNGSARGRVLPAEDGVRFKQTGTSGTVTLAGLGNEFELPVSVVAAAIVPDGRAKVSCGGGRLTIDSRSGVLRMTR